MERNYSTTDGKRSLVSEFDTVASIVAFFLFLSVSVSKKSLKGRPKLEHD